MIKMIMMTTNMKCNADSDNTDIVMRHCVIYYNNDNISKHTMFVSFANEWMMMLKLLTLLSRCDE